MEVPQMRTVAVGGQIVFAFMLFLSEAIAQPAPDGLSELRRQFIEAYNKADYPALCALLHPEASFRGKINPARWTHTADRIITERWLSSETCSALRPGLSARSRATELNIASVGQSDLDLEPAQAVAFSRDDSYVLDQGRFRMLAKPGSSLPTFMGDYVILWKRDGQTLKLKHIDMSPADP
jgi:hypothetical protein